MLELASLLKCDTCRRDPSTHPVFGVASSTLGPISFAFCEECLSRNAEPFGIFGYTYEMTADGTNVADWVRNLKTFHDGNYISWAEYADLPEEVKYPIGRQGEVEDGDPQVYFKDAEEPDFGETNYLSGSDFPGESA